MSMECKGCHGKVFVKNGFVRNVQRYKCKSCGLNFINRDNRNRTPVQLQALAVLLYSLGKGSYGFIGKILKVYPSTILRWVRSFAQDLPVAEVPAGDYDIEFDEMWHFIQSKKQSLDLESVGPSCGENYCLGYRSS